jgi:hypothetical protein
LPKHLVEVIAMVPLFDLVGHASTSIGIAAIALIGLVLMTAALSEAASDRLSRVIRAYRERCGCKDCRRHRRRRP